jgi:hypothetical protein
MKVYTGIYENSTKIIKKDYKKEKFNNFLIIGEYEHEIYCTHELSEFLNKKNIHVTYITGGTKNIEWESSIAEKYNLKKYNVLHLSHFGLIYPLLNSEFIDQINNQKAHEIKYNFCCLNNVTHDHRCLFIDKLAEHNLINNNIVTWNQHAYSYKFNFYNGQIKKLNDNFTVTNGLNIPIEFYQSFCNVVTETTINLINITEKTAKPILLCKPFLCFGATGIHTFLKENYKLELYDEIFDYSFDLEKDTEKRVNLIIENLKKLNNLDLKKARKQLQEKLNYNKQQIIDLARNFKNTIPQEILKYSFSSPIIKYKFDSYYDHLVYQTNKLLDKK